MYAGEPSRDETFFKMASMGHKVVRKVGDALLGGNSLDDDIANGQLVMLHDGALAYLDDLFSAMGIQKVTYNLVMDDEQNFIDQDDLFLQMNVKPIVNVGNIAAQNDLAYDN